MSRGIRRTAGTVVAALVVTGGAVFGVGTPGSAGVTFTTAPLVGWAWTDARDPAASHADPTSDVPLGSWRDADGKHHMSRVYLTYDLSGYAGRDVHEANVFFTEAAANACPERAIELWQTSEQPADPTWGKPRTELARLGAVGQTRSCPGRLGINVRSAIQAAVGAGRTRIALALRVSEEQEGDVAYGRFLSAFQGVQLSVGSNGRPTMDAQHRYNNGQPCAEQAPGRYLPAAVQLMAMPHDPDPFEINLTVEYAVWPLADPTARTSVSTTNARSGFVSAASVPAGALVDGVTYAWQARVDDGTSSSEWTVPCVFTVDAVRPDAAPGVSSPQFPEGMDEFLPGGEPGVFTFTPSGVGDVAAYQFGWAELGVPGFSIGERGIPLWQDPFDSPAFVRATALGGPATVRLVPPRVGINTLRVRSFDRAYQSSPIRTYEFLVASTEPTVTVIDPPALIGVPFTVRFAPHPAVGTVVDYVYRVDGGAELVVPATADGAATVTVTFGEAGFHELTVRSRSANGWISSEGGLFLILDDSPLVTSATYPENEVGGGVGVTGTFTFRPRAPGVTGYVYSFDFAAPVTVPAEADGTASITFTPQASGFHELDVYSVGATGESSTYFYVFFVADGSRPDA